MEWKQLLDFEGYEASDQGHIRNASTKQLLTPHIDKRYGYQFVYLCKKPEDYKRHHGFTLKHKNILVHRVVWSAFNGTIPKGLVVRHLNDQKLDNRLENLAIGTQKENMADAKRNGRITTQKLSGSKAFNILKYRVLDSESVNEIAAIFNVSVSLVRKVLSKKAYKQEIIDYTSNINLSGLDRIVLSSYLSDGDKQC